MNRRSVTVARPSPASPPGEEPRDRRTESLTYDLIDARVVFLTHYIPLYQVRVLQEITAAIREFRVWLSTPIEPNRDFEPDWSGLHVDVQKTITLRRRWRHASAGFEDPLYVHVPYDTRAKLKRLRPDVVVSHELGARSLAAARYCRAAGAKLILATFMSEHTEQGRGQARLWLRRRLIAAADAITHNGPSCREYLRSLGAREEQLFPLPYAADDRFVGPLPPRIDESATRRRLLCIGQLSQRKGVVPLVRQLTEICRRRNETWELTLVGDGPMREPLTAIAHGRAHADLDFEPDDRMKLQLLGIQPPAKLPGIMQDHGVVIAPTLADEWLLVVNEAMHAGMPVIGSIHAQAVTTLVRDGINGWQYDPLVTDPDHPDSLDVTLRRYSATSDADYAAMRRLAVNDVAALTPRHAAGGLLRAVRHVLAMPPSSPSDGAEAAE